MRVSVNNSVYGMNRKEMEGLLEFASKQIPFGIYAVEKGDFCELLKDTYNTADELKQSVKEYEKQGFKAWYNDGGKR